MVCHNVLTIISSKENSDFIRIESCKHLLTSLACQYLSFIAICCLIINNSAPSPLLSSDIATSLVEQDLEDWLLLAFNQSQEY